jgi:hypothetical protein
MYIGGQCANSLVYYIYSLESRESYLYIYIMIVKGTHNMLNIYIDVIICIKIYI